MTKEAEFNKLFDKNPKVNADVKTFVEEQTNNTRSSVKKKAEKLLKKWNKI